jgi:hypothetical protein
MVFRITQKISDGNWRRVNGVKSSHLKETFDGMVRVIKEIEGGIKELEKRKQFYVHQVAFQKMIKVE